MLVADWFQQKADTGIVNMISEGKKLMIESGTVAASLTDSVERRPILPANLFERHVYECHGWNKKHARGMRTHNREEDCKFKNLPESEWEPKSTCPGCSYQGPDGNIIGEPRGHSSHKYDDTCRLTAIIPRNTSSHPREVPIPIGKSNSGNASARTFQR